MLFYLSLDPAGLLLWPKGEAYLAPLCYARLDEGRSIQGGFNEVDMSEGVLVLATILALGVGSVSVVHAMRSHLTRRCSGRAWLVGVGLAFGLMSAVGGSAGAGDRSSPENSGTAAASPKVFKICQGQTYALCAVASCFVFDKVAYCKCDVKSGDSISLPLRFDAGEDVCTVNAEGPDNGYMVSTFSLPDSVVAPTGDQALYTCPAGASDGAYAQCDGGICFIGTEGQSFPGFDKPLAEDQIICSCPITVANPATAKLGYQIAGPYPCQKSFFQNCKSRTANAKTGSTIYVGAETGTARFLARRLYGSVPPLQQCPSPHG